MTDAFYKLPTVILMGVLVVIFSAVNRHHRTYRFRLWYFAWWLIFLRFILQIFWQSLSMPRALYLSLDLASLQLAGIIFLISVSQVGELQGKRTPMILLMGVPITIYAFCMSYQVTLPWVYLVLLLIIFLFPATILFKTMGFTAMNIIAVTIPFCVTSWSIYYLFIDSAELRNDVGFYGFMTWVYGYCGFLFIRKYRRFTPGTIASASGFALWALVSPIAYFSDYIAMTHVSSEIWNLPKFIVAIGMIVTLLEDERIAAESSRLREHVFHQQMKRFGDLVAKILTGADLPEVCGKIAAVIAESSNFERAVILLRDENKMLKVAGTSGVSEESILTMQDGVAALGAKSLDPPWPAESRIGANSYRNRKDRLFGKDVFQSTRKFTPNSFWNAGDLVVIPMRSAHGSFLGMIALDDPKELDRVVAEGMSALEILADDIAGAINNVNLQRQLFRSEKLAGMGQLVTGVAHELNNPLTAILGYSEMLGDRVDDSAMKKDLDIVRREALRMKRIIENLQRFSRQQKMEKKSLDLQSVLQDVLKLRNYELHAQGIRTTIEIAPAIPKLAADDTQLQQVFLNVVNNAIDAVESVEDKRISIQAGVLGGFVQVRVTDSGPGFTDPQRVFDPFFTTKGPGKGTGLGLSICYGIVKEHGGDIIAANLEPSGACVTILLPLDGVSDPLRVPST